MLRTIDNAKMDALPSIRLALLTFPMLVFRVLLSTSDLIGRNSFPDSKVHLSPRGSRTHDTWNMLSS